MTSCIGNDPWLISVQDVRDVADQSIFDLEMHQSLFPEEDQTTFEEARKFLDAYAQFPEAN